VHEDEVITHVSGDEEVAPDVPVTLLTDALGSLHRNCATASLMPTTDDQRRRGCVTTSDRRAELRPAARGIHAGNGENVDHPAVQRVLGRFERSLDQRFLELAADT
jgi:hypothetical protein